MARSDIQRAASDLNRGVLTLLDEDTHAGYRFSTVWTELIRTKLLAPGALNLDMSTRTLKHSTNHRLKQRLVECLTGTLHCAKHDLRHGTAAVRTFTDPRTGQPVAACPLCHKAPDCTGHILGGCRHPTINAMKIARHNKACALVAETIAKGDEGDGFMIVDAVASNCLPAYAHGTRLPKWLLPALDDDTRVKLRPDILYIPSIKPHLHDANTFGEALLQLTSAQRAQHPIILLEVGYCSDLAHDEKVTKKAAQHAELTQLLTAEGCPVTCEQWTQSPSVSAGPSLPP